MIKHLNKSKKKPKRVVIVGSNGFVSNSVEQRLIKSNIKVIGLTRKIIDLSKKESQKFLSRTLKSSDTVFFVAAKAPVKNEKMLIKNLKMALNICEVLKNKKINHFIYLSSDAVYADVRKKLNEKSITSPNSLHGIMHLTREIMISQIKDLPLCIVRPTLIFGSKDPHNGYGPNSFIRLAKNNKDINLFGNGEEKRDHIWVEDVSKIIYLIILYKSIGKINIASGKINSFYDIARTVQLISKCSSKIKTSPRNGPMPHGGYRPFNITNLKKSFPNIKISSFKKIVSKIIKDY